MERAVRLLRTRKFRREILSEDDFARAAWTIAVGKAIDTRTSRIRLVRSTLVVEVEDAIWQKQLNPLTAQILDRLRKVTGNDAIKDLEFRIGIPRREPHRADSRMPTAQQGCSDPDDETDSINDPVLKKIYRLSRRKATA